MSAPITLTGNLTGDPELKFSNSGKAWVRFSIVTNARVFDKDTQKWVEKDPTFWNCTAFGKTAENFVESASKGTRVVLIGTVKSEKFTGKDGMERTDMRVLADELAVSVKFTSTKPATAKQAPRSDGWGGEDEPPF